MALPIFSLWLLGRWRLRARLVSFFYKGAKALMSLQVEVQGEISSDRPLMMFANHCSYVDVFVLGALTPMSFTPKREVRSWPVIGFLCVLADCIFVERKRSEMHAARSEMHEKLAAGRVVALFPEGTTNNGDEVKSFKSGFFSLAEEEFEGHPLVVQPATIIYTHINGEKLLPGGARDAVAWYGDMAFGPHFAALYGLGKIQAKVVLHDPVSLEGFASRKELAAHCEQVIGQTVHHYIQAEEEL